MPSIRFLRNEAGKTEGLAYAGFETFRGSPYTSCARETGQNSRDAVAGEGPVKVVFKLHKLQREQVPFIEELRHSISCCLNAPQDEKTKLHLDRALATVSAPVLRVLEISDTNTTGLTGPIDDDMSVFNALVKGDGVTNKADVTSAGSFGIGKNAAYAVSDLQTVIYSTCYEVAQTGARKFAAQGRLRLISHRDRDNKLSAEGYWGAPNFAAIESPDHVPAWMQRSEIGTSVFSVGFREEANWDWQMTLALASQFFLAIERGDIEFTVGEDHRINRNSLDSVLEAETLKKIAIDADRLPELERAQRLLNCLRSDAASRHSITIPDLGNFTLHLLVADGLPREVHVLRNGIYIADNFEKFSQPMRRFPGTREFTAVLEPARDDSGRAPSALLKQLENPAHDAFEPERIIDHASREKARRQVKKLLEKVREIIRSIAKIDEVQRSHLDELSHIFADKGSERGSASGDHERDPDRFRYGEAQVRRHEKPLGVRENGAGTRKGGAADRERHPNSGAGKRSGAGAGSRPAVPLHDVRSLLPSSQDGRVRTIYFTSEVGGQVELSIAASGLSGDVELKVVSASSGASLSNGRVCTHVVAGERVKLDLAFEEPFVGPIEVSASEVAQVDRIV